MLGGFYFQHISCRVFDSITSMRKETFANDERYHVYNRGAAKCDMFHDNEDRMKFLWNLHHYQYDKKGDPIVMVSSFVLMTNHFHISLLQNQSGGVSMFLQRVCMSYAMYFNKKYERKGCLFSGNFKVKHIDNDGYFLHLTRYIHRNPIEVIRPASLEKYEWSSYRTYIGCGSSPIVTDRLAIKMFKDPSEYKVFVESWKSVEDQLIGDYTIDSEE